MATYESLNYDDRDSVRGVKEASRSLTSTLVAFLVTMLVYLSHMALRVVYDVRYGFLLIPQPLIRCVKRTLLRSEIANSIGSYLGEAVVSEPSLFCCAWFDPSSPPKAVMQFAAKPNYGWSACPASGPCRAGWVLDVPIRGLEKIG